MRVYKPNSVYPTQRWERWLFLLCDLPESPSPSKAKLRRATSAPFQTGVLSYLVLLHKGFTLLPISLSGRWALTPPFHPYPDLKVGAVCFLWHFPSPADLATGVPDCSGLNALRSLDFPPSASKAEGNHPTRTRIHFKLSTASL